MSSLALRCLRRPAVSTFLAVSLALSGAAGAGETVGDGSNAAEVAEKPVVEKVLDILLQQKTISQQQYESLLDQSRREQAEAAARIAEAAQKAPATSAPEEAPDDWTFAWNNGFKLDRNDGAFQLKFGGRIQLDGAAIMESNGLNDDLRALGGDGRGNGVEFRRARIFFEGDLYERLFFKAQYDFAEGDPAFTDVYMGLRDLGPLGEVQVGQFKEPYNLSEETSTNYITFMERALPSVFFPGRNVGVMTHNTALEERMQWQIAVFRGTDAFGSGYSSGGDTDWDVAARLSGVPIYEDEGKEVLHLGAAYIHRFIGGDTPARYRQRPEAHLADRFVDTLNFDADDSDIFLGEVAWIHGPWTFVAEYDNALVSGDAGQPNVDFWGAYAQVSYFLTGEHTVYELAKGKFGRVKPKANFNPGRGGWGAWEIAARYSYLDLDEKNIDGGKIWDVTAGLNWYLFPNARIMLNYVHSDVSNRKATIAGVPSSINGTGDIVQTRLQIDF
jgi:phosphate-selective porin OprO/OprP